MQASSVPGKFSIPWGNSAGGSYIRTVPVASQIGVTNGAASWTDGFPPNCFVAVAAGGAPPFGQDFNGVLQAVTKWNQWQQAGGPIVYDSTFQSAIGGYPSGSVVQMTASGPSFMSTVDNNTVAPAMGAAGWMPVQVFGANRTSVTSTQTLTAYNSGLVLVNASSGNITITLPAVSAASGATLPFKLVRTDTSTNSVTVSAAGSDTFSQGSASALALNSTLEFAGNGTSQWVMTAAQFPSSLGMNGYKKYPDPNSPTGYFIEQWGTVTLGPGSSQSITLPIAFPNSFMNCTVSYGSVPTAGQTCGSAPGTLSTILIGNASGGTNGLFYTARGY